MLKCAKADYEPTPEDMDALDSYCEDDVKAETALIHATPPQSAWERRVQLVDWRMQARGVGIDTTLCKAAIEMAKPLLREIDRNVEWITNGIKCRQTTALAAWLNERCGIPDLARDTIDRYLLRSDLPENCREVLHYRLESSRASTAKYQAALRCTASDGRAHGLTQYCGAERTGRWAGRLIQPQNLPRGKVDQEALCAAIIRGDLDAVAEIAGEVPIPGYTGPVSRRLAITHGLSIATRGMLTGNLVVGDLSKIELRGLLWMVADYEHLKTLGNLYQETADEIGSSATYDLGKRAVLGCGYGMGESLFLSQCRKDGVPVTGKLASEAVETYRNKFTKVVQFWYDLRDGACRAIVDRRPVDVGRLRWKTQGKHLTLRLPSGRLLWYRDARAVREKGHKRYDFVFYGRDDSGRGVRRIHAHGGMLAGHANQANARDILAAALVRADARCIEPVTTIHDEIVCDTWDSDAMRILDECLTRQPAWAPDLPLDADCWTGKRYRKH